MAQPRRIGQGERFVDVEADAFSAPCIVKADVEQMRAQGQLQRDANIVEPVIFAESKSLFDRAEEALGVMIADPTEATRFVSPVKWNRLTRDSSRRPSDRGVAGCQAEERSRAQSSKEGAAGCLDHLNTRHALSKLYVQSNRYRL